MKLIINLETLQVAPVMDFTVQFLPEMTNNTQHPQLKGFALADVTVSVGDACFNLMHCDTKAETGHVDVAVRYKRASEPPTFHRYSGNEQFSPSTIATKFDQWPTGTWSLMETTVAIEKYLERELGFNATLRQFFLYSLEKWTLSVKP